MSRPKITLQEWLGKEQVLKKKFLNQELNQANNFGLLRFQQEHNGEFYITDRFGDNHQTEKTRLEDKEIRISSFCFDKLKDKFRIFKNKEKKSNLIKKQYNLSKETVNLIKKIKTNLNLPREENVIENIINHYINNESIQQNKIKLQTKEIKLDILNIEIEENNQKIYDLILENKIIKDKIRHITYLLAASYLNSEYLKDTLLSHDLTSEHPIASEEKIQNKIFEINELLKESL